MNAPLLLVFTLDDGTLHRIPGVRRIEVENGIPFPPAGYVVTIDGDEFTMTHPETGHRQRVSLIELWRLLVCAANVQTPDPLPRRRGREAVPT